MRNLNTHQVLKIIFSIWGLQVFVPFFTSIGSVSHPGYLPFLCSNGKYCLAEMGGKKVGDCQWDELSPLGRYIFLGKSGGIYFLVGPKKFHKLGSQYLKLGFVRNGGSADFTIQDSISGLYATYFNEPNYLSEFIFTSIPWHNHGTSYLYGPSENGLLLYNMANEEKHYVRGEEIKLHPPFAFIKREGLWFAHDLKLNLLFHEGRQSYLVHNDDLVMYDESDKNIQINPLFFQKDKGMYERADSGFSLLLPYHYLGYNSSRSESLIAYLIQEDSAGNPILYYPDKSLVLEDNTEWLYEFGKIYWKSDSTTGMLSFDRLNDIIIPERIDSVFAFFGRQKLFIKYLNESRDSFKVYDSDLNVSGNMKGQLYDFFWDYFFITFDGKDSLGTCRMYDWKGNLIRADNVSEFRSFRTHEAGESIIRYYGDTLVDAFNLPENFRNMNYSLGHDANVNFDIRLNGWNEFFWFSYDISSKTFTREFWPVNHPSPDGFRQYIKLPDPPPYTYRDFSVLKVNNRFLINCSKPGVQCTYVADEFEIDELDSISLLILSDFETTKTLAVHSNGDVIYNDNYHIEIWLDVVYENNLLLVEDGTSDSTVISILNVMGDTLLFKGILDTPEMEDDLIFYREPGSQSTSLFILSSNVKILDYKKCPLVEDSLQSRFAHLFTDFGLLYTEFAKDRNTPVLKYPWIPRSEYHRENSNFYSDTELGRIYINTDAPNPYFADPDIIQKVSYEGRVIDCSGK